MKNKKTKQNTILRCFKCNGFLYNSEHRYPGTYYIYKGKKHCENCGRDWYLEKSNGKIIAKTFPETYSIIVKQ